VLGHTEGAVDVESQDAELVVERVVHEGSAESNTDLQSRGINGAV
jgi:hypothetical protein